MKKLTKAQVKAQVTTTRVPIAPGGAATISVNLTSLDAGREWATVVCPVEQCGHEMIVEVHEGGSRTECPRCGGGFDYGGYDSDADRVDALIQAVKATPDDETLRRLYVKDSARAVERT